MDKPDPADEAAPTDGLSLELELELDEDPPPVDEPAEAGDTDGDSALGAGPSPFASQEPEGRSPFASQESEGRSPFASGRQTAGSPAGRGAGIGAAPQDAKSAGSRRQEEDAAEPQILIYEEAGSEGTGRLLIFCAIFGLIGALCFAGTSLFYFSIGRRVGVMFAVGFAVLGARLGASDLRGGRVRTFAAGTTGASAVGAKVLMVVFLFQMYPKFNAEDLTTLIDPGKAAAIYAEQSFVNALSPDGMDGQERLDQRFGAEVEDSNEELPAAPQREARVLSFGDVFPKLFDFFDLLLILAAAVFAYKFSGNEY